MGKSENRVVVGKYVSKVWGKSPVLHCTFELADGSLETFGCFRPNNTTQSGIYTPKSGDINLNKDSFIGTSFELVVKQTKTGRDFLYSATPVQIK